MGQTIMYFIKHITRLILFIALVFTLKLNAQSLNDFKGETISTLEFDKIEAFDTLVHNETRGGFYGLNCIVFSDSTYNKRVILLVSNDTIHYTIRDILIIENLPNKSYIQIGSREFDEKDKYYQGFVVTLESYNGKRLPNQSKKIYNAWTNYDGDLKFSELEPKSIKRINEAYYKKDELPKKN